MDGHWLCVWFGRDGIMFVPYCFLTIVLSGFPYAAQSLRFLPQGWCFWDSSVDMFHSVRKKKEECV